jgi:hypothetical protein
MGILRSGNSTATQITKYSGLQIQSTSSAIPIPIAWGRNVLSPNVIWYNHFFALPQYSGGKGGGKGGGGGGKQATSYDYRAAIIMALCEGPILEIGNIWTSSTTPTNLAALGLSLFTGTTPQAPWAWASVYYPSEALGYPGVAYVCNQIYDLGAAASVGDNNFEVCGFLSGSGVNGLDCDPAQVIYDFLTNSQYGVGFPAASIDANSLYANAGDSSYQTYCWTAGIAFSPVLNSKESASSILSRWLQLTNSTVVWSGGVLKFLPLGDSAITASGKTWTPNLTVLYALTDEDFLHSDGEDPIKITRSDPYAGYNQQSVEIQARNDSYNTGPVTAFDQSAIERFGLRAGSTVTAHEICDIAVGQRAAQLILQRGLYIRNTYEFRLSAEFCLLDPMDLVSLTDPLLGLNATVVRITDIEEADDGTLSITAEEFPQGVATSVAYPVQAKSNGVPAADVTPNSVNSPLIIEPPPSLSGGSTQLWIGASAQNADPNWGGCIVWASLDGISYSEVSAIAVPARQGVLSASLAAYAGSAPDNANTLAVDLTESGGTLQTTNSAAAAAGVTLCYVDGEYLAYTTATLTATSKYNLTALYRGLGGSTPGAHAMGASFCLLDSAILKYDVPNAEIGQTVYLKFQSINIFGGAAQDISTCAAYPYQIQGTGVLGPVATTLAVGTAMDYGLATQAVSETDDFGTVAAQVVSILDLGNCTS